jgi:hypothetical protein
MDFYFIEEVVEFTEADFRRLLNTVGRAYRGRENVTVTLGEDMPIRPIQPVPDEKLTSDPEYRQVAKPIIRSSVALLIYLCRQCKAERPDMGDCYSAADKFVAVLEEDLNQAK